MDLSRLAVVLGKYCTTAVYTCIRLTSAFLVNKEKIDSRLQGVGVPFLLRHGVTIMP